MSLLRAYSSILGVSIQPFQFSFFGKCLKFLNIAKGNPVVNRVLKWLQPGAPGIDIGDARVRGLLVAPVGLGGVGLSRELARPLLASAEVAPEISGADVSTAWPFGV